MKVKAESEKVGLKLNRIRIKTTEAHPDPHHIQRNLAAKIRESFVSKFLLDVVF